MIILITFQAISSVSKKHITIERVNITIISIYPTNTDTLPFAIGRSLFLGCKRSESRS